MEGNYQTRAIPVVQERDTEQATFIRKTYMHVALAVLLFVLVETLFLNTPFIVNAGIAMITGGWTFLLVMIAFMFAINYLEGWAMQSANKQQQYLALIGVVMLEAFIFVPLIYIAIAQTGSLEVVNQAALMTLFLFSGLTAVVFITGKDFSFLRSMVTMGIFIALGLIVAGMIFGFNLGLWFSVAMIGLTAAAILYQTSSMMLHCHKEQYVGASIGLFASLMTMFWYVLQIFMSGD